MKQFLKFIYGKISMLKNIMEWKRQRPAGSVVISDAKSIQTAIMDEKKVLIVVPHPDDDLIGCDHIIKKYSKQVTVFYSGMLGSDYSEQNRRTRTTEFENYCKYIDVDYCVNKGDMQATLKDLLLNNSFGYVFVPTPVDWHEEHRILFKNVIDIIKNEDLGVKIFCYQITVPIPAKYITHYSEMTKKEQQEKWNRFKEIYISQKFMPTHRFKTVEEAYSKNGQQIIAEVFMEIQNNRIAEDYICEINKKEINNLAAILESAGVEYGKTFGD